MTEDDNGSSSRVFVCLAEELNGVQDLLLRYEEAATQMRDGGGTRLAELQNIDLAVQILGDVANLMGQFGMLATPVIIDANALQLSQVKLDRVRESLAKAVGTTTGCDPTPRPSAIEVF